MTAETNITEVERLRALADRLDCLIEQDFQLLADATPGTTEAWRKRNQGPDYIRLGNRVFYPIAAVSSFMQGRIRERKPLGKALL